MGKKKNNKKEVVVEKEVVEEIPEMNENLQEELFVNNPSDDIDIDIQDIIDISENNDMQGDLYINEDVGMDTDDTAVVEENTDNTIEMENSNFEEESENKEEKNNSEEDSITEGSEDIDVDNDASSIPSVDMNLQEEIENTDTIEDTFIDNNMSETTENPLEEFSMSESSSDMVLENDSSFTETSLPDNEENPSERLRMPQIFIGKNYDKLLHRKFSFSGFFFGGLYFIYRKMYLIGIVLYLFSILLTSVIPSYIGFNYFFIFWGISFAFSIIIGFVTNKVYVAHAKKKLNKIRSLHKTYDESAKLCKKQGGTNLGIAIVLCLLISTATSPFINTKLELPNFDDIGGDLDNNDIVDPDIDFTPDVDITIPQPDSYNGVLQHDTSVVVENDFDIEIPSVFTEGLMMSPDYMDYEYIGAGVEPCKLNIYAVTGYSTAYGLIDSMASYLSATDTVSNITINGSQYLTFTSITDTETTYYYSTEVNGNIYIISYIIPNSVDTTVCEQYLTQIINSIVTK